MKSFGKNLILLTALALIPVKVFSYQKSLSADDVLQKTSAKLSSLKTIKYQYQQEYNYKSEAYFAESKAESFLDFTPLESVIGLRFQFDNPDIFIAYNGSEIFSLRKKDKTIEIESKPKTENLSSKSYLQFSPLMWRNVLPEIIADKTIIKSIRDAGINNYVIELTLDKAFIDSGNGNILPMTTNRKTIYRLTIDNKTFLPIEIYRGNNINDDFNKTTFSEIVENPTPPTENSWYYSTYLSEYKYAKSRENNLIKIGETTHEVILPLFGTDKAVSLSDYKGKVILLDFFIFHCGACQASVPKLNALQEKYKDKNFKLLTINVTDSEKLIQLFIDKTKPQFPILHQGEAIAKQYGVWYYPTVVLIGKDGNIIYSGEFEKDKIDELIKLNL